MQVIPQPCEFCGSTDTSFRSYMSQWICYRCRIRPDQLVLTMNNMRIKYKISKSVLLAGYVLSKTPPGDISTWTFDTKEDEMIAKALVERRFRGPLDLFTLPNPHQNDAANAGKTLAPMRLMKDDQVKAFAELIYGKPVIAERIREYQSTHPPPAIMNRRKRPLSPSTTTTTTVTSASKRPKKA